VAGDEIFFAIEVAHVRKSPDGDAIKAAMASRENLLTKSQKIS
jgi:hypothetical protein